MYGLPEHAGRYGTILLVLGVLVAAAVALRVWRELRRSLGDRWAATLLAASLLSVIATAPYLAWRIVEDLRVTTGLTAAQAERAGGDMVPVDHRTLDRVKAIVPAGETFYVTASPAIDPVERKKLSDWAGYQLLPRIRVRDPGRAQWILAWNRDPRDVRQRIDRAIPVGPEGSVGRLTLGRVER